MNCSVCGREFDERGYQLLVPGRTGSFDTFECAVRAQGLPWLGPSPHRQVADVPPFELPLTSQARHSVLSFLVPDLARVRTRAVLAGATALLVAVTTASAYVWLRDGAKTSADRASSPGATVLAPVEAPPSFAGEQSAEASAVSTQPRAGRARANGREVRGARRPTGSAALLVPLAGERAETKEEKGEDVGSMRHQPAPPAPPPSHGAPPSSPPALPPLSPAPDRPRQTAPPEARAPVADAAASAATRPGWGHGDKNHAHAGPPGLGATKAQTGKKPRTPRRRRRRSAPEAG